MQRRSSRFTGKPLSDNVSEEVVLGLSPQSMRRRNSSSSVGVGEVVSSPSSNGKTTSRITQPSVTAITTTSASSSSSSSRTPNTSTPILERSSTPSRKGVPDPHISNTPSSPAATLLPLPRHSSSSLPVLLSDTNTTGGGTTRKRKRTTTDNENNANDPALSYPTETSSILPNDNNDTILPPTQETNLSTTPVMDTSNHQTSTTMKNNNPQFSSPSRRANIQHNPVSSSPSKPLNISSSPAKQVQHELQQIIPSSPVNRNLFSPSKSQTTVRGKSPRKGVSPSLLNTGTTISSSIVTKPTTGKAGGLAALAAAARNRTGSLFSSMVIASPTRGISKQSSSLSDTHPVAASSSLSTAFSAPTETKDIQHTQNIISWSVLPSSSSQLDTHQYQRLMNVVRNTRISTPLLEAKRRVSLSSNSLGTNSNPNQIITKSLALNKALEEAAISSSASKATIDIPRTVTFPAVNTKNSTLAWPVDHQLYTFIRFRSRIPFVWISPQCLITDDLVKNSLTSKFGVEGRINTHALPNLYQTLWLQQQQQQNQLQRTDSSIASIGEISDVSTASIDTTVLNITATNALLNCGRYLAYPASHWSTSILNVTSAVTERFYTKVIAELQIWERDYNARKSMEERSRILQNKSVTVRNNSSTTTTSTTTRGTRTNNNPSSETPSSNSKEVSKNTISPSTTKTNKKIEDGSNTSKVSSKGMDPVSRTKSTAVSSLPTDSTTASQSKTLSNKTKVSSVSSSSPPFSNKKSSSTYTPFTSPRRAIPVVFRTRSAEDIAAALRQNIIGGNTSMKPLPVTTANSVAVTTTPSVTSNGETGNSTGNSTKATDTGIKHGKKDKDTDNHSSSKTKGMATERSNNANTLDVFSFEMTDPKSTIDSSTNLLSPSKSLSKRRRISTNSVNEPSTNSVNEPIKNSNTENTNTDPHISSTTGLSSSPALPLSSPSIHSTLSPVSPSPTAPAQPTANLRIPTFPSWLPGAVMSTSSIVISGTNTGNRHRSATTSITGIPITNTVKPPNKPRGTTSLAALASSVANISSTTNISSLLPSRTSSSSASRIGTVAQSSSSSSLSSPTTVIQQGSGYSPFADVPPTAYERILPILNSLTKTDKDGIATWLDRVRRFQEALASVWSILSSGIQSSEMINNNPSSSSPITPSIPFFMLRFGPQERTGNVILIGKASFLLQLENSSSSLSSSSPSIQPDTVIAIIARSNLRLRLCLHLAGVPYVSPLDTDLPAFDRTFNAANVGIQESLGVLEAALSNTGGIGVPVSKEALGMMALTLGFDSAGRDLARVATAHDTTKETSTMKGTKRRKTMDGSKTNLTTDDTEKTTTMDNGLTKGEKNDPLPNENSNNNNKNDDDDDEISFAIPNDNDDENKNDDDDTNDGSQTSFFVDSKGEHLKRSRFGISNDPNSQSELRGTADSATSLLVIEGIHSVQLLIQLLIDAVQPGAQLGSSLASMVTYHNKNNNNNNESTGNRGTIIPRRALLPLGTIALLGSGNPNTLQNNANNASLDIPQIITLPHIPFRHACICELEMNVKQTTEEVYTQQNKVHSAAKTDGSSGSKESSTVDKNATVPLDTEANTSPPDFEKRWDLEIRGPILPTILPKLWGLLTTMQMREYTIGQAKDEGVHKSSSSSSSKVLYGGKDPYYIPPGLLKLTTEGHYTTTKFTNSIVQNTLEKIYEPLLTQSTVFLSLYQRTNVSSSFSSPFSSSSSSSILPLVKFLPWKSLASLATVPERASHTHRRNTVSSSIVVETMRSHYLLTYKPDLYYLQQIPLLDYMNTVLYTSSLSTSTTMSKSIRSNTGTSSSSTTKGSTKTPNKKESHPHRTMNDDENISENSPIMSITDMKFRIDNIVDKNIP